MIKTQICVLLLLLTQLSAYERHWYVQEPHLHCVGVSGNIASRWQIAEAVTYNYHVLSFSLYHVTEPASPGQRSIVEFSPSISFLQTLGPNCFLWHAPYGGEQYLNLEASAPITVEVLPAAITVRDRDGMEYVYRKGELTEIHCATLIISVISECGRIKRLTEDVNNHILFLVHSTGPDREQIEIDSEVYFLKYEEDGSVQSINGAQGNEIARFFRSQGLLIESRVAGIDSVYHWSKNPYFPKGYHSLWQPYLPDSDGRYSYFEEEDGTRICICSVAPSGHKEFLQLDRLTGLLKHQ